MSFGTTTVQAQLINHNRRSQIKKVNVQVSQETIAVSNDGVDPVLAMLDSQPAVRSRVERIYDMDKDGQLQREEVVDFLGDVVRAVERRGHFAVTTGILVVFDKDKNNEINQSESRDIYKYIE